MAINVLFVCLGNICRSPTAHGVFEQLVKQEGLSDSILVDSAGTGDWHVGEPPDSRAQSAADARGYQLDHLVARQLRRSDFDTFDYILAMDHENLRNIRALSPESYQGHLGLFLEFGHETTFDEVPDPYFGGDNGFDEVLDMVEDAAAGLFQHICRVHRLV